MQFRPDFVATIIWRRPSNISRARRVSIRVIVIVEAAMTYLVPPISVFLGWLLLSETPASLAYLGGALCLAGVGLSRRR